MNELKGKVAIVTGASRGVGKGVALGLAEYGATVYVTGRTVTDETLPPFLEGATIYRTAELVTQMGGIGIAHRCDHANDNEVAALFERVMDEQGRLDILVNSAWAGGAHVMGGYFFGTPFWQQPQTLLDDEWRVGVRSAYVAAMHAARIMTAQKSGLIVNISYYGGRRYWNNVSYGVCKAALDKLSADAAHELKEYGVAALSLYPGSVATEGMLEAAKYNPALDVSTLETPQFVGRCVAALALDKDIISKTGQILITAEVGERYGIRDIDGKQPKSQRAELW